MDLEVVEELQDNDTSDCKLYNLRQEVLNIFELYLNRKPSIEEIQKYSAKGNEQDILVAIIQDFNIPSSDSDKKKSTLDTLRKDHCETKNNSVAAAELFKDEPIDKKTQVKMISFPYDDYLQLKEQLSKLQEKVVIMD